MHGECGEVAANFNVRWAIKSCMTWSAEPHGETSDLYNRISRWGELRTMISLLVPAFSMII